MKIRGKLLSGYILIAFLTALVGGIGVRLAGTVDHELQKVADDTLPDMALIHNLRFAGLRIAASTMEYCFQASARRSLGTFRGGEADTLERELISEGIRLYHEAVKYYGSMVRSDHRNHQAILQEIERSGEALILGSKAIVVATNSGASNKVLLQLKDRFEEAELAYMGAVGRALSHEQAEFARTRERLQVRLKSVKQGIMVVAGLSFALALLVGFTMAGYLSRRLNRLRNAAEVIGRGNLEGRIDISSRDEIGDLANSFNGMIEELKRSRDEVINARDNLSDIIHSMMDSLIVAGPDGRVQRVNVATCTLLGYDEEPVGIPLHTIMADDPMADLACHGVINDMEKVYLTKDGRPIPVAFSGSVMWQSDGSMQGIVCVARDIRERKEAEARLRHFTEELQEANEDLRNFTYIASHDLRSPLVNIKGFSSELAILLDELRACLEPAIGRLAPDERARVNAILSAEAPEALEFIGSSVNRMDSLTSAILKLSRLGRRELLPELVKTDLLLKSLLQSCAHQLEHLQVTVRELPLPDLKTDRLALEQIFGNLLDNAIKFQEPNRPGEITVSGRRVDGETIFEIRDNGRGIAEVDREKVFEIFRRVGPQDVPGEGMGLAYVKALLRRLGGRIWFESELGRGTVFYVAFPGGADEHQ